MYLRASMDNTYFCTCYGDTDVAARGDPAESLKVRTKHHDRPLSILSNIRDGHYIHAAVFEDHKDVEVALINALVGREPPSSFSGPYGDVLPPPTPY